MRSTRDNRLDLLLFGPGQGRSGCGVAALWCTTHAGFGHFSPTYRVPSGTSRAKSGRVYSAQTSMTVTRLVAGSAGLNAAGIMPKVHDMWVNCRFGRQAGPMSCHSVILMQVHALWGLNKILKAGLNSRQINYLAYMTPFLDQGSRSERYLQIKAHFEV